MHDVAVALDHHLFRHADAAKVRDPSKIISPEIDQHYVLSALFWIDNQIGRKSFIFRQIFAARISSGDRTQLGGPLPHSQMNFRRTAKDREIAAEA